MTTQQVLLITGTSNGFCRRIAQTLAQQGHTVFASMRDTMGRNASRKSAFLALAERAGLELHVLDLDVTNDASVEQAVSKLLIHTGRVDVLVNNAGVMYTGIAKGYTLEQAQAQMETNFFSALRLNRAVLPTMRQQRSRLLVQMSSVAGGLIFPFLTHYSASKMAHEALAQGYRYELSSFGINSVLVESGPCGTGLLASQQDPRDQSRVAGYSVINDIPTCMLQDTVEINTGPDAQDPQAVTDVVAHLVAT